MQNVRGYQLKRKTGVCLTVRNLTISFGAAEHLGRITGAQEFPWLEFAKLLTAPPPETEDKASEGWFIPAQFNPRYRDSENLVSRHALTLDYDHVTPADVVAIQKAFAGYEYAIYTTASHTKEKPRIRVVMPTTRPMSADEFCAVSRKVASWAGIELASRESHVPAQLVFLPTVAPGREFKGKTASGQWLDVDAVLALYKDWTDRSQWPTRKEHDGTYKSDELPTPAREKPGIVGDFCRAFSITDAIERFQLPYQHVAGTRWTYTAGSRPEGMRTYDDDTKAHNENDTNPARGQHNAFDLVRLQRFHVLDAEVVDGLEITARPSFKAMVVLALEQPEIRAAQAGADFEVLPPLGGEESGGVVPESKREDSDRHVQPDSAGTEYPGATNGVREVVRSSDGPAEGLARKIADAIRTPTIPRWLIKDTLERGVIAVMAGPRGNYKSFLAFDWALACAIAGHTVYGISAEGGDFDRRAKAWLIYHGYIDEVENVPLYIAEKRLDLSTKAGIDLIRADCSFHGIRPVLFVLDTFSKLSGGLDENDNSKVKAFIGMLDNGLKRAFDATVLLVAHTGHTEQGRPRGASALGADTDAEYIVARNASDTSVSVTRQRFKSSPELPPLNFQPEIVDLDYNDAEGRVVTSLVMVPTDGPIGGQRIILKKNPGKLLAIAREMLAENDEIVIADLLDRFVASLPHDGKVRDRRRRAGTEALGVLVEGTFLALRSASTIGLTQVTQAAIDDFKKG